MSLNYRGVAVFLAALGALAWAPNASATAVLILDDGTATDLKVITDGSGADALPGVVGAISWTGSVGNWIVTVTTGETKPLLTLPEVMHLNSVDTSIGAGTLNVYFYDSDFQVLPASFTIADGGVTAAGGSMAGEVFGNINDPADIVQCGGVQCTNGGGPTALATGTVQIGTTISGVGAWSGTASGVLAGATVPPGYALAEMLTIVHTGSGTSSGDYTLSSVPEPTAIALLGGVLLFTVGAIRRKAARG